jgi:phosphomannomutase
MQMLEHLSTNKEPLSATISRVMKKYPISGEINTKVDNVKQKIKKLSSIYKNGKQSWIDGISVEYDDFRFNVRPSNTEPLLRLNLEAKTQELVDKKTEEVIGLIRS